MILSEQSHIALNQARRREVEGFCIVYLNLKKDLSSRSHRLKMTGFIQGDTTLT